jgi:hypothetical protein
MSTEVSVQPGASAQSAPLTRESLHTDTSATRVEDDVPIQDEEARHREEIRMLIVGFGTGIFIALIFLVYIAIAYAGVLP